MVRPIQAEFGKTRGVKGTVRVAVRLRNTKKPLWYIIPKWFLFCNVTVQITVVGTSLIVG